MEQDRAARNQEIKRLQVLLLLGDTDNPLSSICRQAGKSLVGACTGPWAVGTARNVIAAIDGPR